MARLSAPAEVRPLKDGEIALIDLLDRLLSGGAVLTGDLTLSIADVDLVRISLRAVIHAVNAENPAPWIPGLGRAAPEPELEAAPEPERP
ncbi:gas vesicle protein [Allostreptomyces psammosilenae]|nr:gas vesicle protein [Allostreptomyces psammosilenae]